MIIGFDGRYAEGDLVGVGKFIQNLVSGVAKMRHTCIVFYSKKPKNIITGATGIILNSRNRCHFEQVLLSAALKKYKVDLYHATGNIGIPLFCPVPSVLTVHDIIPLGVKDYFSYSLFPLLSKLYYLSRLKTSLLRASKIVTDSKFVKEELIKKLNIKPGKIQTIYLGASMIAESGKLPLELIGKKYILNHGGIDIRKNLEGLIKAFAIVHKENSQISLVITGENKRIREKLEKLISKLNLENSIIFTGYVEEKTLNSIIRNALIVCYPTLSEGFGFPILEAFSYGIPVISSNTSSIPEIAKGASILVNPNNERQIANAILRVLKDNKLANNLKRLGLGRVKDFSWKKTANEYLNLYHSIK
jgi:glycosyltransferase involved in cell wall biosynthesis